MSESSEYKHILVEERDGAIIVRFRGSRLLDEQDIREIGRELCALTDRERPRLVLRFQNVKFLASLMLGKLITVQRWVAQRQGKIVFCDIPDSIFDVFRLSNLDNFFPIARDVDEALKKLS